MLFGNLDGGVEALVLQQREAVYDEERRLSDGSGSCWGYSGSDSDSEAESEVGSEPLALEGAVVVVTLGGGVVRREQPEGWQASGRERMS